MQILEKSSSIATMNEYQYDPDAVQPEVDTLMSTSPVDSLFSHRSVLITGASGFIGRVLLEKLLRSYKSITRIYILLRSKRNVNPQDRLRNQILNVPIFNKIRSMECGQQILDKIVVLSGDIAEENWALSEADLEMILGDLSLGIVFHCAATVRFDEPLKRAVQINLGSVDTLIKLCKRMPNLVALCHVSSAYVNSHMKRGQAIEEQLYPINYSVDKILSISQQLDVNLMQQLKPLLVGERPNTYTYTKALAEHLIALKASQLPVAIVRPSIVVASWQEPLAGWIDNLNGPTGLMLAYGKGLMRTMHAKRECKADIVPVDCVVNCMIAAAYYAASSSGKLDKSVTVCVPTSLSALNESTNESNFGAPKTVFSKEMPQNPPIFHCVSGDRHPFTWGEIERVVFPQVEKYPSQQILRYPGGTFKANRYYDAFMRLFVHYLPALLIDLICMVTGKKQQMMSIYQKMHAAIGTLQPFATTAYNFKSTNMTLLEAALTHPLDRRTLYLDISKMDWQTFWENYVLGTRRFVLKEEDNTLEQSRRSFRRAYYRELLVRVVLTVLALYCLLPIGLRLVKSAIRI